MRRQPPWLPWLLAAGVYLLGAVVFTWPLVASMSDAVWGDRFDAWTTMWLIWHLAERLVAALAQTTVEYPHLVKALQERIGCLMYAATCTRPDLAFFVHQMCQCLQKPTPELLEECDHALSYLARLSSVGLTYSAEQAQLAGFSDAASSRGSR